MSVKVGPDGHLVGGWNSPPHCGDKRHRELAANFGPNLKEVLVVGRVPAAVNASVCGNFTVYPFDFILNHAAALILIFFSLAVLLAEHPGATTPRNLWTFGRQSPWRFLLILQCPCLKLVF